ncbi:MAG: Outer rane lipoprotein LolB, partial [Gammaproteobacteria bacterium]|nr:Outer rane lipoprotein LolB [Gammaproteobacteria bacterium]
HEQTLSPQNLLLTLKQDGWQIDYINYQPVGLYALPAELTLKRGDLSVRILVKEWTL